MDIEKTLESLSPNERKILPHVETKNIIEISKKSNLDKTSVIRSLEYLKNKGIIELETKTKKIIDIGTNGALYKKKGLPERRLLNLVDEKRIVPFNSAQKDSGLSPDEFKASIGALKKRSMIEIKSGKIVLGISKEEVTKKMPEELFLESIPLEQEKLNQDQQLILKNLQYRKEIVEIKEEKEIIIKITDFGKKIIKSKLSQEELIETITPELLKKETNWKGKKFRRYDVSSPLPQVYGGKRHFVNQAIEYARNIWKEMGFEEMTGNMIQSSFWNFDALFTAQDHPVREMQDTFFISDKIKKAELPDKRLVTQIKTSHETGKLPGVESKGWRYTWNEEEAKKLVLRTHTTCLSALKLANVKKEELPKKYFAIGKCFRNETVDWNHGFEFNQTEGIVIDKDANFRHLIGYLKEFYKKMGFEKIRIRPAYFPYTEPSLEIDAWHPERKVWLEIGGAGILRPEVVVPLLGENIPVLAWGPGFDRIIMDYYQIKDLREMYKNDLNKLRKTKFWMKG